MVRITRTVIVLVVACDIGYDLLGIHLLFPEQFVAHGRMHPHIFRMLNAEHVFIMRVQLLSKCQLADIVQHSGDTDVIAFLFGKSEFLRNQSGKHADYAGMRKEPLHIALAGDVIRNSSDQFDFSRKFHILLRSFGFRDICRNSCSGRSAGTRPSIVYYLP